MAGVSVELTGVYAETSNGYGWGWGTWGRDAWGSSVNSTVETGGANAFPTGLEASTELGTTSETAGSKIYPVGVVGVGVVIRPLVWGQINDNQTPNWQGIDDSQADNWAVVDDSQAPNWQPVNDAQTGNWVQVADGNTVIWVEIPT
jgi:hypothetical protein